MIFIFNMKNKKVKLADTVIAGDSINENIYGNVKNRVTTVCKYTFIIELIGAILLAVRFVPAYGIITGLWYSIFHSIIAFCNTGFTLFGNNSLIDFQNDLYVNMIFMILIVLGGIGFFVIEDIVFCKKNRHFKNMQLQSKIVIFTTCFLILGGTLLFKVFQPDLSLLQSMFLSITLRTAGFTTTNLETINPITKIIGIILMFIGGAPGSTSGGIRIIVFAIIVLATIATIEDRKEIVVFSKKILAVQIRKSVAIFVISIGIIFISSICMYYLDNIGMINILYHCTSAFSATGLETVPTNRINLAGQVVMMILMFIGRVTPLSVISLFVVDKKENNDIEYPEGKLML